MFTRNHWFALLEVVNWIVEKLEECAALGHAVIELCTEHTRDKIRSL